MSSILRRANVFCALSVHWISDPQAFVYSSSVVFIHMPSQTSGLPRCNLVGLSGSFGLGQLLE
jgi:hypothetical protein